MLTYREIAEWIATLTEEQKDSNVTVYLSHYDEYIPVKSKCVSSEDDVLDKDHPYLVVE